MSIRQKSAPKSCPARRNRKKKDNADIAKKPCSSKTFEKRMQTGGMEKMKDEWVAVLRRTNL